jgi:hypothetical protein
VAFPEILQGEAVVLLAHCQAQAAKAARRPKPRDPERAGLWVGAVEGLEAALDAMCPERVGRRAGEEVAA